MRERNNTFINVLVVKSTLYYPQFVSTPQTIIVIMRVPPLSYQEFSIKKSSNKESISATRRWFVYEIHCLFLLSYTLSVCLFA